NSYLGLIRQSQRGFDMDYHVSLAFENINAPQMDGYGVDHVTVAEGLGCKALRVTDPEDLYGAFIKASGMAQEFQVPVVVEVILERRSEERRVGTECRARRSPDDYTEK